MNAAEAVYDVPGAVRGAYPRGPDQVRSLDPVLNLPLNAIFQNPDEPLLLDVLDEVPERPALIRHG